MNTNFVCSYSRVFLPVLIVLSHCFGHASIFAQIGDGETMSNEERTELMKEAREMFRHAYRAYMENAYPADELMPLSCSGRWRGTEPSRGDIDDCLGNFSLTLIDTLDTLVIMGDLDEFEHAVKLVIKDVSFDSDIIISVFETNIRVLGGLLSGHILAEYLQQRGISMRWYQGELLNMARDLGYRLMPAFNTSTGIPHARINLKYGMRSPHLESSRETCTACAGTMILEMAALSRLTGEPLFEEKAHRAMDELWNLRHRSSDLMGTVLNVHSGDWVRRDSGVGAGIDSYYEYCLKAYILLGDEKYLGRFNKHYNAVMKYISQGPMLLDVHMHRPHTNSRNYMDALLAFWPGLQVLKGDLKPAVETHEMLYQVMQRHNFIPEAFTKDFQVHWGQHPLRPEFLESTYFLYRATGDPYYLEVGRKVLQSLQKFARVPCGYAAVKDVRTNMHEDRMDSFVLAETFKYLYLLFADPSSLVLNLDEFLFTTEAHLLPLSLARHSNYTFNEDDHQDLHLESEPEFSRSCPNTAHLFPESVRKPLRKLLDGICLRKQQHRKLLAVEFQAGNPQHVKLLREMGIILSPLEGGKLQFQHTFSDALSPVDAEEGLLFLQEMVQLAKEEDEKPDTPPRAVSFSRGENDNKVNVVLTAGAAHFGKELKGDFKVQGNVVIAKPFKACSAIENADEMKNHIAVIERGNCMFVDKARQIEKAGAIGGIVIDNTPGTSSSKLPLFVMAGDEENNVGIPVVFLFHNDAAILKEALEENYLLIVTLSSMSLLTDKKDSSSQNSNPEKNGSASGSKDKTIEKLKDSVQEFLIKQEIVQAFGSDFRGMLERRPGGQEIIRISRSPKLGNPSVVSEDQRWAKLRELLIGTLGQGIGSSRPEVSLPAPLLRLYWQIMEQDRNQFQSKEDDPAMQIQAAWLLTELAQLGIVSQASSIKDPLGNDQSNIPIRKRQRKALALTETLSTQPVWMQNVESTCAVRTRKEKERNKKSDDLIISVEDNELENENIIKNNKLSSKDEL